jgi:hypothetical protein
LHLYVFFLYCFQQELIQLTKIVYYFRYIKNVGFVSSPSSALLLPGKLLAYHLKIQEAKLKDKAKNRDRLCQPNSAGTRLFGEIVGVVAGLLHMSESGVSSVPLGALKTNK